MSDQTPTNEAKETVTLAEPQQTPKKSIAELLARSPIYQDAVEVRVVHIAAKDAIIVQTAIQTLGYLLEEHNHQWDEFEEALWQRANEILAGLEYSDPTQE